MPEVTLVAESDEGVPIITAAREAGIVASASAAKGMLKQGAIRVNGESVKDPGYKLLPGEVYVCQAGKKKFAQVTVTK